MFAGVLLQKNSHKKARMIAAAARSRHGRYMDSSPILLGKTF